MTFAFVQDGAITEYPVTDSDIRRKFPGTSFPKILDDIDLSSYGAAKVNATDQPSINRDTHRMQEGTPSLVNGSWQQTWNVIELTAEELQDKADGKAATARLTRDQKLAACDWTVLADSPLTTAKKTEWKAYRTELRNITAAEGFPHTMEWPTEPS
tara:strand:- start:129 stop:596 length:468 start_codon:yes stop_codon:yes gene_type:complete